MILFIADVHIKLGQKKVPKEWQINRFNLLAKELSNYEFDTIVVGGDLFDVPNPSIEEVGLMYDFLYKFKDKGGIIIPGNHEMTSKVKDCFLPLDYMLNTLNFKVVRDFESIDGIDYIPYNIIHNNFTPVSEYAVTHVRGEIPPHVTPEVDLAKFAKYKKVFAGDLHSYKNTQANIYYPGSPMTVSFNRNRVSGSNGFFLIDSETKEHEWVELKLPQLIRKTVSSVEDMVGGDYDHIIYEIESELADLANIKSSDLLDKKIVKNISKDATLDLSGDIEEELKEYLIHVSSVDEDSLTKCLNLFKERVKNAVNDN